MATMRTMFINTLPKTSRTRKFPCPKTKFSTSTRHTKHRSRSQEVAGSNHFHRKKEGKGGGGRKQLDMSYIKKRSVTSEPGSVES